MGSNSDLGILGTHTSEKWLAKALNAVSTTVDGPRPLLENIVRHLLLTTWTVP